MKNEIIFLLILILFAGITGCSDNPVSGSTIGGIGGTTSTVSFAIMSRDGQNGGIEFLTKPSIEVTLTSVNVKVPEAEFDETYECDGVTIYTNNEWHLINEFTGVGSGMKFAFNFIGKTSPGNKDFNVTSNYTVP